MKKILFILLPVFLFAGCGIWTDFTTYFNIYYDTADNFQQAEQLIKEQKRDLFSTDEVPIPGTAAQLLNKVIEKASKILQFHAQSSYVDNSLLLLGKAFYYQKDYLKGMRKFQELITTHPNSKFILESQLWIGKSQMRLKQFDAAMKTLNEVKDEAVNKKESDIYEDAYLEQIKYRVITGDNDLAISLMNEFLKVSTTNEISGQVSFELGKLYFKQNDPQNAITAFQNVFNYSPSYDLTLNTRIELSKALRKNGEPQKALVMMQNMRKEIKYSDVFHRIELELALSLIDLNRIDEGIQALVKIDTLYASTTSAGAARFELGKIYESKIPIYDSASTYYTKASLSTGSDPKMLLVANAKAQLFKKYQYVSSLIEENKKQLRYLINPDDFVKDSIAFISDTLGKSRQDDLMNQNKSQNLYDRNSGRDESRLNYVPSITNSSIKKPPVRPLLPIDTLKANLVKNEFDLGNIFFTEMDRPDSASFYYNDIIKNYSGSVYEARALYALGIYYETMKDSVKADSLYNLVYNNFKSEKVVNAAATKINKPLINFEYDPAEELYADAESDLIRKNFTVSLDKLYNISDKYPKSPIAAKALYASGWILENNLKLYDSAAVVYDTLTTRYPKSVYASRVNPELSTYKIEIKKRKAALADSLAKIDQIKNKGLDSLNVRKLGNNNLSNNDSLNTLKKFNNINLRVDSLINKKINEKINDPSKILNKNTNIDSVKNNNNKGGVNDSLKKDIKKTIEP